MTLQVLGLSAFYSNRSNPRTAFGENSNSEGIGVSGRYGFLLPFYSWFSVYARMSLQYSVENIQLTAIGRSALDDSHALSVSIFVRLSSHSHSASRVRWLAALMREDDRLGEVRF